MPELTGISFTAAIVENLGDYSSSRPSLTLHANVLPGENADDAIAAVIATAQKHVRDIVDNDLIKHGLPPRYYDGPQYDVLWGAQIRTLAIAPAEWGYHDKGTSWQTEANGLPLTLAQEQLQKALAKRGERVEALYDAGSAPNGLPGLIALREQRQTAYNEEVERERARYREEEEKRQAAWRAQSAASGGGDDSDLDEQD